MRLLGVSRAPAVSDGAAGWPSPRPPWPCPSPGGPSRVPSGPRRPAEADLRDPPELLGWKPPPVAPVGRGRGVTRFRTPSDLLSRIRPVPAPDCSGDETGSWVSPRPASAAETRASTGRRPRGGPGGRSCVAAAVIRPGRIAAADAPPSTCSSRVHSGRRPLRALDLGSRRPASKSRSVLVVSHHLDGFLRARSRGLVASRCRSWGSLRFRAVRVWSAEAGTAKRTFPAARFTPLEGDSPVAAAPRHRGRCPLAVGSSCRSARVAVLSPGSRRYAGFHGRLGFKALLRYGSVTPSHRRR